MRFVTGQIRGGGDRLRQQSPELLLIDLGILMASFYKHCCWQWRSNTRSMRVGCSRGSEAPLVLVSPYLEMLDSDLKVSCLLLIQHALTQRFNCDTLDKWLLVKSDKVYWLATIDLCAVDSPENLLPLKRDLSLWHIPRRWYYPSHIEKWTGLLFCVEEELFF
jgi:hypothetical protein